VHDRILITGGAGFIGSHVADELLREGFRVRALDALVDQVHEDGAPTYLDPDVELVVGDVRDRAALDRALDGVDGVVHLAARVGVGQSMYELREYADANTTGTAQLLEALLDHRVSRLVVASSMSIYGEGLYRRPDGAPVVDVARTREQLERHEWDPAPNLEPLPTPEWKPPSLQSVYALTKHDQERLCLVWGASYGVPTVALRFFNVYGPRQALSNPYTGVLAIFASRLLNGKPPLVYEDGEQRRDFVSVRDVARAVRLALDAPAAAGRAVNVGSGRSASIREIASLLALALESDEQPVLTGRARSGDIRHCFADVALAHEAIGFHAEVGLEEGIADLVDWLAGRRPRDGAPGAHDELERRGLTL
jgi:dTDP-L-rhamnose 4-epimerase